MSKKNTKTKTAEKQSEGKRGLSRPAFVLIAIGVMVFLIYSMVSIIGIQSQIRERKAELKKLNDQIKVQEIQNQDIKKLSDQINAGDSQNTNSQKLIGSGGTDFSALAEQIARDDLGYIKEGERVFVNVAGE